MDDYAWSHRPLIVFSDRDDHPQRIEQKKYLQTYETDFADRAMVLIEVINEKVFVDGEPVNGPSPNLRERYGVSPAATFAVLLVGKDTGIKLRRDEPVKMDEIFGLIDSMPMRQREMSERPG